MAEINTASQSSGQGARSTKKSTRVDMTPMVDLGFLLITFFMLTTTMTWPKTMDLFMPKDEGDSMSLPAKKALTVILGPNNRIAWYEGIGNNPAIPPQINYTSFANQKGIRDIIISKKEAVYHAFNKNDLMILIKADKKANYKNVVDIMDEMLINKVDRYAIVDITKEEETYFR
ncbi:outer membrane transport energization protein ExbD [Chitinophaga niastensis]|uniref:Outer membrane transport energization protein ExbD n=1 Tax=Chitinophaga niastensis TaxID=536980 RepID=A0A2P8HS40_CHINA|nr:biopolymer transporter ExbD [Chitinophaga niastensis]PSL49046.1 outer membrane transport energization protein ExbD [Chitinophaga niastensis]